MYFPLQGRHSCRCKSHLDQLWQQTGPAVRFELDGHVFVLAQGNDRVRRLLEGTDQACPASLLPSLAGPEFSSFLARASRDDLFAQKGRGIAFSLPGLALKVYFSLFQGTFFPL
jgi:hypothetical protein